MDQSARLGYLREALQCLKDEGRKTVRIDALQDFMADSDQSKALLPEQLEEWKARIRRQEIEFAAEETRVVESFRAVMTAAHSALKCAIIINGGAAVALLAYIGAIVKEGTPDRGFVRSLVAFAVGVLFGAIASGGTYLAQRGYHEAAETNHGKRWAGVTAILVIAAYGAFISGCLLAAASL